MAAPNLALFQEVARIEVVSLTTADATLYGLSLALSLSCCRLLLLELPRDKCWRKQNLFTLFHMSLIMICGLLNLAADTNSIQVSWVDHPTATPAGSLIYYSYTFSRTAIAGMGYVVTTLIYLLTHGAQIWRLSIMWRASRYHFFVIIIPSLALLGSLVIEVVTICDILGPKVFTDREGIVIDIVEQSLTLFTGLIVTSLISGQIALARRKHIEIMGTSDISNHYFSIISMLVESFALEFVWTITSICTALAGHGGSMVSSSMNVVFIDLLPYIQLIAYLLVVYRVSTGRAWKKDTKEKLTSLQFNHEEQQTTQLTTTRASIHISGDATDAQA
ncbi:hypothetical protein NP233_g12562 [Leucocoprinus birnbaumii]|uniref:Uncharacterized protein n=1 Tax=Leucocoprinus birnbaumii TaxID=56174 RepID=A0AAD5VEE8_9AGAR|nr:hypothetical protein NP233_g12562 [Leucocoprinus birnbaumii]